jgi:molecular chaperone DnaK
VDTEAIIGIDLGTTNSEVAVVQGDRPRVLEADGEVILPSVVGLSPDGKLLVGQAAKNQWLLAPQRTIQSVKRHMGEDIKLPLGDQFFSPQEVSAMILRVLKARAEQHLGRPVPKAVITVPAYFNDAQRQATREAGELAGLEVVRVIHEPTAASLVYEPHHARHHKILVYDLGGGTFDVSIVSIEDGVIEVLASHGDTHLGGDDFDALLVDHVADEFQESHGVDLRADVRAHACLLRAVEAAKRRLSVEPYTRIEEAFVIEKDGQPLHLSTELDRHVYEDMIRPLIEKTMDSVHTAMSDARLLASQIDRIVLAGGATRTPLVRELLRERTGCEPHLEVDPDLCVAMGAAVQASIIAGEDVGPVLVDVTPHTFGISCLGEMNGLPYPYCFSPIIPKNSALPTTRTEVYYTHVDHQDCAAIEVYQGDDPDAMKNTHIGKFMIEGLSDAPSGNPILCRLDLDLNGMLKVTAREKKTGLEKHIVIDNAMSRFESHEMAEASHRLQRLFGDRNVDVRPDEAPSEHEADAADPRRVKVESLIRRARATLASVPAQDQDEVVNLIERIHDAMGEANEKALLSAVDGLEEILFYVEEA